MSLRDYVERFYSNINKDELWQYDEEKGEWVNIDSESIDSFAATEQIIESKLMNKSKIIL